MVANRLAKLVILNKIEELKQENVKFNEEKGYFSSQIESNCEVLNEVIFEIVKAECREEMVNANEVN